MSEASPFNFLNIENHLEKAKQEAEDRANRLMTAATQKSEAILKEAIEKRDTMFQHCEDEGYKAGFEKGLQEGKDEGEAQFVSERKESLTQSSSELAQVLHLFPQAIEKGKEILTEAYEKEFLALALEVASMVVHKDLKENGFNVTGILEDMLQQVLGHQQLVVEVHADHEETLRQFLPGLYQRFHDLGDITVRSVNMDKNKVKVRTEKGSIESSPDISLQRLREEWNLT